VIYFYTKDDSPGCTKEACSFRDQFEVVVYIINSQMQASKHVDEALRILKQLK
jgi:peroxiredoxin